MNLASAAASNAASTVGAVIFIVGGIAVYFLPALIAWRLRSLNAGPVLVINLFLGWTFVGWVVALAMAVSRRPPPPVAWQPPPSPWR